MKQREFFCFEEKFEKKKKKRKKKKKKRCISKGEKKKKKKKSLPKQMYQTRSGLLLVNCIFIFYAAN